MSHMVSVRDFEGTTHVWLHEDGQTLSADSLPTDSAWNLDDGSKAGEKKWFQTLALVSVATEMVAEYFGERKVSLDWLGKGWKVCPR